MLFPVCVVRDGELYRVTAPDVPACIATDPDAQRALTRMHLLLEGFIAQAMIDDRPLPDVSDIAVMRADPVYAGQALYEIHINPVHLRAVARHQTGR